MLLGIPAIAWLKPPAQAGNAPEQVLQWLDFSVVWKNNFPFLHFSVPFGSNA